jgi:hypothetical protein
MDSEIDFKEKVAKRQRGGKIFLKLEFNLYKMWSIKSSCLPVPLLACLMAGGRKKIDGLRQPSSFSDVPQTRNTVVSLEFQLDRSLICFPFSLRILDQILN